MPLRCSVDAHVLTDAIPTSVRVLLPPQVPRLSFRERMLFCDYSY